MPVSRVLFNGRVIFDISSDTVTKDKLLVNETAHNSCGDMLVGYAAKRGNGKFNVDQNGMIQVPDYSDFIISD